MKFFKISPFVLGLFALVLFSADRCKDKEGGTAFDIQARELTFYAGPYDKIGDVSIGLNSYKWNLDSVEQSAGYGVVDKTIGQLVSVRLVSMEADLFQPAGGTFDGLSSIRVSVSSPGQEEVEVAFAENIAPGTKLLKMQLTNAELKPHVVSDEFSVRVKGVTTQAIEKEIGIHVRSKYNLEYYKE